jgi:L(+)-tartrate dehydratase beta subunit
VRIVIGKGGLREDSLQAFADLGGVYLAIVGGAAALETTWIEQIEDVDLDDLNPESLWRFRIRTSARCWWRWTAMAAACTGEVWRSADAQSRRAAALAALGVRA